jgi:hypothetical protein
MNKRQRQILDRLDRVANLALNFVRVETGESCTRLCAVMCCGTGCFVGLLTTGFAFAHPRATATIVALTSTEAGLITSGCVALLTRTRPAGNSKDSKDSNNPA